MTIEKTIVDRNTWLRGEGQYESYLHRLSDGKKCCLGFEVEQHYSKCYIGELASPSEVEFPDVNWLIDSDENDSDLSSLAMSVNDCLVGEQMELNAHHVPEELASYFPYPSWCSVSSEEHREAILKEIFKLGGRELEFIN